MSPSHVGVGRSELHSDAVWSSLSGAPALGGLSWRWPSCPCLSDLYVYAVLVCCVGILSVLLFTLTIIWQSVFSKRKSRGKSMDKVMSGVGAEANHRQTEGGRAKYHFGWKTHPASRVIYLWLVSKVSGGGMSPLNSATITRNHCWHHCSPPLSLNPFLLQFLSALNLSLPPRRVCGVLWPWLWFWFCCLRLGF